MNLSPTQIPSMMFEKRSTYSDCWVPIELGQLRQEISDQEIDSILVQRATVRTPNAKYRRAIPEVVKDWAKS